MSWPERRGSVKVRLRPDRYGIAHRPDRPPTAIQLSKSTTAVSQKPTALPSGHAALITTHARPNLTGRRSRMSAEIFENRLFFGRFHNLRPGRKLGRGDERRAPCITRSERNSVAMEDQIQPNGRFPLKFDLTWKANAKPVRQTTVEPCQRWDSSLRRSQRPGNPPYNTPCQQEVPRTVVRSS